MAETITCQRCRMTFVVEPPVSADWDLPPSRKAKPGRCPEPKCKLETKGRRFWHAHRDGERIRTGVYPEDLLTS